MKIEQPHLYIDHMLRTTRMHHVQLSSMADVKASMLLTIASVIITLTVGSIMKPGLMWPAMVLIFFCLVTIVLAAYAVMPKMPFRVKAGPSPDLGSPFFNLLFFGDFVRMEYDEFEAAMEETLNDHSRSYRAMVKELYTLGMFLATKKYRLIRLAYISFIAGLIASCLAFLLVNIPS
ncbi:Pycsar system effector family protein [Thermodesulfobacteriota bacterium]